MLALSDQQSKTQRYLQLYTVWEWIKSSHLKSQKWEILDWNYKSVNYLNSSLFIFPLTCRFSSWELHKHSFSVVLWHIKIKIPVHYTVFFCQYCCRLGALHLLTCIPRLFLLFCIRVLGVLRLVCKFIVKKVTKKNTCTCFYQLNSCIILTCCVEGVVVLL